MGFFGGLGNKASSKSSTNYEHNQTDNRAVVDGGSLHSTFAFTPRIDGTGKNSRVDMNTTIIATDHGAVQSAFSIGGSALRLADKAIESNTAVTMHSTERSSQLAAQAIENARRSAEAAANARAEAAQRAAQAQAAAAQQVAQARSAAAAQTAANAKQSLAESLRFADNSIDSVFSFANNADARNHDGFARVLNLAADLMADQSTALANSQVLTAQAFETAETTAAGALDQKTVVTIVLAGAAVLGLYAVRRAR